MLLVSLIGFVLLLIWVLTLVDIVRRPDLKTSSKVLWALLVLIIPIIGLIIYFIASQAPRTGDSRAAACRKSSSRRSRAPARSPSASSARARTSVTCARYHAAQSARPSSRRKAAAASPFAASAWPARARASAETARTALIDGRSRRR